jgi:peptidoglycan/xylan/chitin deacetylase (PgdA/CDA1 family)
MIPARTPFFLPWLYPDLTWRIHDSPKSIYLTFDDGPVPGPTDFVLDTLTQFSVPATFFCIGDNVRKHPDSFASINKESHAIGNHTFHHVNGWKTNTADYVREVALCNDEIAHNGCTTKIFRPPYGRISRKQVAALPGYQVIMWDVLTHDYNSSLRSETCLKNSVNASREGSIVVFHDSFKAEKNLRYVLPRYIDHFLGKGYVFKKIDS